MAAEDKGILGRLLDRVLPDSGPVSELIGRYVLGNAQSTLYKSRSYVKTYDQTRPDYEFWDKLRRCKATGYTLSGLFCERIENIFATWVLGQGVSIALAESGDLDNENDPRNLTDQAIADFLERNADMLLDVFRDKLGLGDQWIIVNADGTLSIPSPDTVEPEWDDLDYRQLVAVTVTTKTDNQTIEDRYTAFERTVTIKEGGQVVEEMTFENLIGRIPVTHIPHARSGNETYGHPIHEELRPLYDQYDDLIFKQLDGAKLLGNPIPVFEGMEDIDSVIDQNAPAEYNEYTDKDGNTVTHTQLTLDQNSVMLVGKGGSFKFAGPTVGFTEDTKAALKSLFLLLLDHTGIPEFIWGGELTSSRSTAETQMDQWVRDVKGRQVDNATWLREMVEVWLLMVVLVDAQLVVDALVVAWPEVIPADVRVLLDKLTFAKDRNLITDRTALTLLGIVPNPEQEAQDAQAEADERREALFPDGDTFSFQRDVNEAQAEEMDAGILQETGFVPAAQPTSEIHVHMPPIEQGETIVQLDTSGMPAPAYTINVPPGKPPDVYVNVEPATVPVTVQVPEQTLPDVNVTMETPEIPVTIQAEMPISIEAELKAPDETVETETVVERDPDTGRITRTNKQTRRA